MKLLKPSSRVVALCVCTLSLLFTVHGQVKVGPWEKNEGGPPVDFKTSSDASRKEALDKAQIPTQKDAGWELMPGSVVNYSPRSVLKSANTQVDYTFFQTVVTIPQGVEVKTFQIKFDEVDDAARVTIFNSKHPHGKFYNEDDIIGKQQNLTLKRDFKDDVVVGENRVVITQYDIAPVLNNIKGVHVLVDGVEIPPALEPVVKRGPIRNATHGEVHISTPDGLRYDYQGTGEFMSLLSDDKKSMVQARQEEWPDNPKLSINTAAAVLAEGHTLEFYLKPTFKWYIDGKEQEKPAKSGKQLLSAGTDVSYSVNGRGMYDFTIMWADGSMGARVQLLENASINIGAARFNDTHTYAGVFGNLDKDPKNDLTMRSGEMLTPPADIDGINKFQDSWRLQPGESLFKDVERAKAALEVDLTGPLTIEQLAKSGGTWEGCWDWAHDDKSGPTHSKLTVKSATEFVYTYMGNTWTLTGNLGFAGGKPGNPIAVNLTLPDGNDLRFVWNSLDEVDGQFWNKGKKAGVSQNNPPQTSGKFLRKGLAEALAKVPQNQHTDVQIPEEKWDAAAKVVQEAGITSPVVARDATYDVALTDDKSFIETAKTNESDWKQLPPEERKVVAGDHANLAAVAAENKANGFSETDKGDTLHAGETLNTEERLTSANGDYILRMQEDGHLCVYHFVNGQQGDFVWGSGKYGFQNAKLVLQTDGNLVVYDGNNAAQWNSETHPYFDAKFKNSANTPVKLVLENDGTLNLYTAAGVSVWSSK